MKVFVVSLPFDQKNIGDYDHCSQLVKAMNETSQVTTEYINSEVLNLCSVGQEFKQMLDPVLMSRNKVGSDFYEALNNYYKEHGRLKVADTVKQYIRNDLA